jgi:hypothetical protein
MLDFFNVQNVSPTSSLAQVGAWSTPFFNELMPIALVGAGILIAGILAVFVIQALIGAFHFLIDNMHVGRSYESDRYDSIKKNNKDFFPHL